MATDNQQLPTVLEGIVSARRGHLEGIGKRIAHVDPAELPRSTRSLYDNLHGATNAFIMECKSASPSLGQIREHYQPGDIARIYSRYAAGVSVLCEPERFNGDYDHLATVAASTHLPVLCKDFIVDPVQIHAARYYGADAILLMLSVLSDATYADLAAEADRLGLDILTEVIDEDEVARAVRLGAKLIGINHRNLHDLSIDLGRSQRLARLIPPECAIVAESGIRNNQTVRRLGGHANAFLVGSQLTSQPDIDAAARELVYGHNKVCGITRGSVAQAARAAGAVYGGLVFEDASPRNVSRETAAEIMAAEPALRYVAVSRRTSGWGEIVGGVDGLFAVQIHSPFQGDAEGERRLIETVRGEVKRAHSGTHKGAEPLEIWRAVSMTTLGAAEAALELALSDAPLVHRFILDTGEGGTGSTFDWSRVPHEIKDRALLAGGIGVDNVSAALSVGTAGVDLNSGLEPSERGAKDTGLINQAFAIIRKHTTPEASTAGQEGE